MRCKTWRISSKLTNATCGRICRQKKKVYAVIFRSENWKEGLKELWHDWSVYRINLLLSDEEKNIVFYEEIEKGA